MKIAVYIVLSINTVVLWTNKNYHHLNYEDVFLTRKEAEDHIREKCLDSALSSTDFEIKKVALTCPEFRPCHDCPKKPRRTRFSKKKSRKHD
jgi:hypothetical protein